MLDVLKLAISEEIWPHSAGGCLVYFLVSSSESCGRRAALG